MDIDNVGVTSGTWDGTDRRGQVTHVYDPQYATRLVPPMYAHTPSVPPTPSTGGITIGTREFITLVMAIGSAVGVWVNLNQELTTLKLKLETEEKRVESVTVNIKEISANIEQLKSQSTKDKQEIQDTVRELDNTISQMYNKMSSEHRK